MGWRRLFDLLDDRCPWIYLINNGEEAGEFGTVSRKDLKLLDKVVTSLRRHESQFVDIATVALLCQFESILLQIKCTEQLVDWQAR